MRDLPQLKSLFRKNIKVVPGGPAVGTPGSNRAEGVLNALDALAEEVKDIDAYTKQEVDYLLDGQIGYLPDLPTVAKNNIVSSIRELSRQKVSIAALAPTIGPLAYFASYAEAEQYALPGDTIYLSGTHASISVAKSISLHGGNIKELTVGYRTGPLAVNVAGALCGGRIVTCVPTTDGGKHTVTYTNILTGPATFFEQFGLEGGNGAWADVTISQTRLHNRGAYIEPANGVPAGGCVRFQERGGRYSRYTALDSTLRSDNNAVGTGYPDSASKAILAGSTDVQPGAGRGVQETMLLNSGVVQPDEDIIIDQRDPGSGGGGGAGGGGGGGGGGTTSGIGAHITAQGTRDTGPVLFFERPGPLSLRKMYNVDDNVFQVNYLDDTKPDAWVVSAYLGSLTEVEDVIATIPAANLALGAELRVKTIPLDNTLESILLLNGFGPQRYAGHNRPFLSATTGPPPGNIILNSQFREALTNVSGAASGWFGNTQRTSMGGGKMTQVNSNPGAYLDCGQGVSLTNRPWRLRIGITRLDQNSVLSYAVQVGNSAFGSFGYDTVQQASNLGEIVYEFTPNGGAHNIYLWGLLDGEAEYCYLTPF